MKISVLILLILLAIPLQGQSLKEQLSRDSINLALSYGAQAMDLIQVYKRQIDNLKAEVDQVYGIAGAREMKVEVLSGVVEKVESRTFWQKLWAWVRGAIVGAAIAVVVLTI